MKKLAVIFTTIGTLLLVVSGFLVFKQQQFLASASTAKGEVVQLVQTHSGTYKPIVHFAAGNGALFVITSTSSSKPPAYDVGESVTVYYPNNAPEDAQISGFFSLWGVPAILGGISTVFVIIGSVFLFLLRDKAGLLAKLKVTGIPVQVKVSEIYHNHAIVFNGKSPYQVLAEWIDPKTGQEITFRSANLWQHPTELLPGAMVTVYIDKANPKRYAMALAEG